MSGGEGNGERKEEEGRLGSKRRGRRCTSLEDQGIFAYTLSTLSRTGLCLVVTSFHIAEKRRKENKQK